MAYTNYQALLVQDGLGSTVELGVKVSEKVLPKIFEREAFLSGYMVGTTYQAEAENAATIIAPVFKRPDIKFVNMEGAGYNPYNPGAERPVQTHKELKVNWELNKKIAVSEAQILQNVVGGSIVSTLTSYLASSIAEQINIHTADAMVGGSNEYNSGKALNKRKIQYVTEGTTRIPSAIAKLKARIGNAEPLEGDTSFNSLPISAVISNTLEAMLLDTQNQFILESSYGQEILVKGTFGNVTLKDNSTYKGKILGCDMFVIADAFFPNSEADDETFAHKPTAGAVLGIFAVAQSTERQFIDRGVKVVDAVDYRGVEMQPLYRMGVTVVKPWGIGLLVTDDYVAEDLEAELVTATVAENKVTALSKTANSYKKFSAGTKAPYMGTMTGGTSFTLNSTTVASGDVIVGFDANGKAVIRAVIA